MTDTVDLMVVGVDEDIPRAKMSEKLVRAFKQEAYSFEALLDGAYGESAPYAAQTNVDRTLAEDGKEKLEGLGLKCAIVNPGEVPEVAVPASIAPVTTAVPDSDAMDNTDGALAEFKTGDAAADTGNDSDAPAVEFETEDGESGGSALASFKKKGSDDNDANNDVDFSSDLDDVGGDTNSSGLANAKASKVDVASADESLNHDFSDQLDDVGSDDAAGGLKEARQAKPDFDADVKSVDFSEDASLIGLHETEEEKNRVANRNKLEESETVRNLNSFPKEAPDEMDFSDELSLLAGNSESGAEATQTDDDSAAANTSESKSDVPEALAGAAADDLNAELIDPAPAEKKEKAPVDIDDGGLSLSTNDSAPLTKPKEKADPDAADDGGLSLSNDAEAPITAPKPKANPEAGDDGGLSLGEAATNENVAASAESKSAAALPETPKPEPTPEPQQEPKQESKPEPTPEKVVAEAAAEKPAPAPTAAPEPQAEKQPEPKAKAPQANAPAGGTGLVLPGQLGGSFAPSITPEDELDEEAMSSATDALRDELPPASSNVTDTAPKLSDFDEQSAAGVVEDGIEKAQTATPAKKGKAKKVVAAIAGAAVLAGAGSFAFMNAGSITTFSDETTSEIVSFSPTPSGVQVVEKMKVEVASIDPGAELADLSTGELLGNLSNSDNSSGILDLEPYFLESGSRIKSGPRIGAAVPAESESMIGVKNRVAHPADQYFDEWSSREADLSLFLALLDSLIEQGDLEVAQQLSDRAKDKLFAVMSSQRLARAYSDVGEHDKVSSLMSVANRETFAIAAPEERVVAISDYALTEQTIGLNEDAMDTFLKATILARSLGKPETRTVGLSSAAIYFQSSGRVKQAHTLLKESLQAGFELPDNTAARDLAIRYVALSEARMGLFNQALTNARTIVDPFASVSAFHGIALAIESAGDTTNARKVLNMAYRAGSQISDKDERSKLLAKVVLASEIN